MFVEPRLVPQTDLVEFVRVTAVDHLPRDDHGPVQPEHQALHELHTVHPLQLPLQGLHHLLQGVHRSVVQSYEPLGGDDLYLDLGEKAEGAVAPRYGVEEVWILVRRTLHERPVSQDQLVAPADVLEEPPPVTGGLYAGPHHQTANGELVQLGDQGEGPAHPVHETVPASSTSLLSSSLPSSS